MHVAANVAPRTQQLSRSWQTWPLLSLPVPPFQPNPPASDPVIWTVSPPSKYHVSPPCNAPRAQHPLVTWQKPIWFSMNIHP